MPCGLHIFVCDAGFRARHRRNRFWVSFLVHLPRRVLSWQLQIFFYVGLHVLRRRKIPQRRRHVGLSPRPDRRLPILSFGEVSERPGDIGCSARLSRRLFWRLHCYLFCWNDLLHRKLVHSLPGRILLAERILRPLPRRHLFGDGWILRGLSFGKVQFRRRHF